MENLLHNVKLALSELYPGFPDAQGDNPLVIEETNEEEKFVLVIHPKGVPSFLFPHMDFPTIKDQLARDKNALADEQVVKSEDPNDDPLPNQAKEDPLSRISPKDRKNLDWLEEIQPYSKLFFWAIPILISLGTPSIVSWIGTFAANQAIQATMDWHQDVEARITKLEYVSEYKEKIKALQNRNETLENRLKQLESAQSTK